MKVINKTNFDTISLRKLFTICINADEKIEGKLQFKKYLKTTIGNARQQRSCSGWAYKGGRRMKLNLTKNATAQDVAEIFLHELSHIRGYGHDVVGRYITKADEEIAKKIVGDFQLEMKKPRKTNPKEDLQNKRYEHVIDMITTKEKQLKRIQNQLKKWKQKRRYYERVMIAAGKIKPQ